MTASPEFLETVRALFHELAELTPDERALRLGAVENPAVRAEVESLFAANDESPSFLNRSVWDFLDAHEGERLVGSLIGPYRITGTLGQGGMGSVFLAQRADAQFEQQVALKLVRGGAMLVARFRQERQILATMTHPNIARLLDGGTTTDGLPYLVMDYVDGVPLDVACASLPITQKLRLFLEVCDAVEYAHRNLVIHRDLKPANILVTAEGAPKLLDFGIAKLAGQVRDDGATQTRLMTPAYASPEQLEGRPVTTASDVYSLGVILYELLTGHRPFELAPLDTRGDAPLPSRTADAPRSLRGDLDNIILMALEPDVSKRYGSVGKFADDIRRYLGGHPVTARRATFAYRAAKFIRRNVLVSAAAVVILLVILIGFVSTLRQKRIAERRFEQVRSLAHSVVFELHDAIEPLPGSTKARALLVRRALVYLDALAGESASNAPLQLELASAYLKIGDVQGMPYRPNLGDTAGAMASYHNALRILSNLPENDAVRSILADAHDHLGFVEERAVHWPAAFQHHHAALDLRQRIVKRNIAQELALARTWVAIGDCLHAGGRQLDPRARTPADDAYRSALAVLAHVPPEGPHRQDLLTAVARAHQRLGGFYTSGIRDYPRAIVHHDLAVAAMNEQLRAAPDDAIIRRNLADELLMKAIVQTRAGSPADALQATDTALATLAPLAQADPENLEAQHDLAFAHEQRALALEGVGRWEEAERAARTMLDIRQRLVARDPKNREDRRLLATSWSVLAAAQEARGDKAGARESKSNAARALAETEK